MSYATLTDLQKAVDNKVLIDLTDDADLGSIDADIVDNALAAADVEIDFYLGEHYVLPLSTVPPIVTELAVDLAVFKLYARREGPPDHWQKRYDLAIRRLERIRDGVPGLGATKLQASGGKGASSSGAEPVFSEDTLANF